MNGFQRCIVCAAGVGLAFAGLCVIAHPIPFNGAHFALLIFGAGVIVSTLTRKARS